MKAAVCAVSFGLAFFAGAAMAQTAGDRVTFEKDVLGGARAVAVDDKPQDLLSVRPSLSEDACRQLAGYRPEESNDATYSAGVDAGGRPVVEADIGGSAIPVPRDVTFRLSVDMAEYLGLSAGGPNPAGYIDFGEVTIRPDGQALLDGQPMESRQEAALRALCDEGKQP